MPRNGFVPTYTEQYEYYKILGITLFLRYAKNRNCCCFWLSPQKCFTSKLQLLMILAATFLTKGGMVSWSHKADFLAFYDNLFNKVSFFSGSTNNIQGIKSLIENTSRTGTPHCLFREIWKPKNILLIYLPTIRVMITYPSLIRWPNPKEYRRQVLLHQLNKKRCKSSKILDTILIIF